MPARQAMHHRAIVERAQRASDSGGGFDTTWQEHLADEPCRCWFVRSAITTQGDKPVIVNEWRLVVPIAADVVVGDRLAEVTDRLGFTLFDGPAGVDAVGRRRDHQVLTVRQFA